MIFPILAKAILYVNVSPISVKSLLTDFVPLISARLTCVPAELLVARPLKVVPPAIGVY